MSAPGGDSEVDNGIISLSQPSDPSSPPYAFQMGTSQATPHVAGTIALLKYIDPSLTTEKATTLLQNTSRSMTSCDRDACGTGIIDANAAVTELSTQKAQDPGDEATPSEPGAGEEPGDGGSDDGDLGKSLRDLWDRVRNGEE